MGLFSSKNNHQLYKQEHIATPDEYGTMYDCLNDMRSSIQYYSNIVKHIHNKTSVMRKTDQHTTDTMETHSYYITRILYILEKYIYNVYFNIYNKHELTTNDVNFFCYETEHLLGLPEYVKKYELDLLYK